MRFVVGTFQDVDTQAALVEEQRTHNDFQLLSIQETYENLVLKVLSTPVLSLSVASVDIMKF